MSENNKKERRRILELSSPQSSGRTKTKVQLTPVRKIRSRLTSKLNNRSFEQNDLSDVEIDSNRATCSSGFEEFTNFSIFQNINVTLYYYLTNEVTQTIQILISEDKTIAEFIKFSLEKINETLKNEKKNFLFDTTNTDKYSIREVKKNGNPNYDFPVFNYATTLQNCKEDKFSLTWDDETKSNLIYINPTQTESVMSNPSKNHHKKKDSKEPVIKKYRISKQTNENKNEGICIIY